MFLRKRFNLSQLAIKYSRLTLFFWLAVAVAGILAFCSLKSSLFPNITFPVVIVNARASLATVLDTEAQLTQPIEESIQSLTGLREFSSSTYPGQTVVQLLFRVGSDLEDSTKRVKASLAQLSLPQNASLEVHPFNLNESTAISYAIKSEGKSLPELSQIAQEQIIPAIARLSGVLRVDLLGDTSSTATEDPELPNTNPATLVRFNGENVLAFQVIKRGDANTLEVVNLVEEAVQQLRAKLPDVQLVLAETQADYIRETTQATIEALFGAIILAILVVFPFLRNWRASLITAVAIPISLLGTFIVMAIAGFNLETLTLLALALVVGIIIDDAIVEVENIARHIEAGQTPRQAALTATREIGLTVSVTTLTIVAVFLPIALMGGTLGQFFRPFALTVSAAVLISLLVARTLSPVLAVRLLKSRKNGETKERQRRLPSALVRYQSLFLNSYSHLLNWSLNHRPIVIVIATVSFIAGIALIPFIPQGFIPQLDRGEFNIVYTTPLPNLAGRFERSSLSQDTNSEQLPADAEPGQFNWIRQIAQSPTSILLRRTRRVGEQLEAKVLAIPEVKSVFTIAGVRGEPNRGKLYVKLKKQRQLSTEQVQEKVRTTLPQLAGVTTSVQDILFVETGDDTPLKVALVGDDLKKLQEAAIQLKTKVDQLPGLVDLKLTGDNWKTAAIQRFKGQRAIYLSANLAPGQALGDATERVVAIAHSILPNNITLQLQGDSARVGNIIREFGVTLLLAVICMSIVIFLPFGRWLEPLVVGLCLPLSIVGVTLALLLTQNDFGMISLIGLIFLLGLLDKNAILLMDYANQLRQSGLSYKEAIFKAGIVRLRPILMTTASTILGMLPIALGIGAGAELRQPMAVAIIGGLFTSSLLSLIVVPVVYTLLEEWWSKVFKGGKSSS
jgi:multidrug efflux pump subunit AcrB